MATHSSYAERLGEILEEASGGGRNVVSSAFHITSQPGIQIQINGVGLSWLLPLPLTEPSAQVLKKASHKAPHGRGEKTVYDDGVRNTWELNADQFTISNPDWNGKFMPGVISSIQKDLGLEGVEVHAELYKLLLYEPGSHFKPHKDTEKSPGMFSTLVVLLPSSWKGGELVVRHAGKEYRYGADHRNAFYSQHIAFYADCEHEVTPVASGHRLCLIYNLCAPSGRAYRAPLETDACAAAGIAKLARKWQASVRQGSGVNSRRLFYLLEHDYTQHSLSLDGLKGADAPRVDLVRRALKGVSGVQAYLALLTVQQHGYDEGGGGYYDYDRYHDRKRRRCGYDSWDDDEDEDDEDEDEDSYGPNYSWAIDDTTYELDNWVRVTDGASVPLGAEKLNSCGEAKDAEWLPEDAVDEITEGDPDDEDIEGPTGNAGATVDRWYYRGILVIDFDRSHWRDDLSALGISGVTSKLAAVVNSATAAASAAASSSAAAPLRSSSRLWLVVVPIVPPLA